MNSLLLRSVLALVACGAVAALSSCNTTRGFGRDVQKAGNKIQQAANRVERG